MTVAMHIVGEHGTATKEFHYEILNNARLSPLAMMATVFNALHGTNEYGEDITHRMNGVFSVKGYPDVTLRNTFAPQDNVTAALTAFGKVYLRGRKSIRKREQFRRQDARELQPRRGRAGQESGPRSEMRSTALTR